MTVLNYTTKVPAAKTISEVQELLAKNGAARIAMDYADGRAVGVAFGLDTVHGPKLFSLPVDVDAMHRLLLDRGTPGGGMSKAAFQSREHAERVAWRVIKDWLAAQLTLVQSQMASIDQVMLPYLRVDNGRTLYTAYRDQEDVLALEGPR